MKKIIKNLDLRVIADSGQCFRFYEIEDNVFDVYTGDRLLRIYKISNNEFDFKCNKNEFKFYENYFDLKTDYNKYSRICDKKDIFLKRCIEYSKGLRILNQDKFEMIISFIISQRKSIKAIRTSIERLAKLCGKKCESEFGKYYAFPTAEQIVKVGANKLASCGLGYRLEYILDFCKDYLMGKYDLEAFDKLNNEELLNALMEIKGVGLKVASCVALFAYHRIDICPKDVWINRVIDKKYAGKFPDRYKKYAGIIQQYWFNYSHLEKDL